MIGYDISVIIPLYNEEGSLKPLWERLSSVLKTLNASWEVLFVDDGSTDNSYQIIQAIASKDRHIKIIHYTQNRGKAAVLQSGFQACQGKIVITMDADLQDDPHEIPKLLTALDKGYDLVSGWKKERHDPWHKTMPSFFFNGMIRIFSRLKIHDINCGFKAYRQIVVKNIAVYGELYRFIPLLAINEGFKVGEVPVRHHPRRFGQSKYGIRRFLRGFMDLVTVLFLTNFMKRPLHLFGPIGALLFLLGFVFCAYLTFVHFAYNQSVGDRPLLLFGILFILTGLQLIFTGLIAELITYHAHQSPAGNPIIEDHYRGESHVAKDRNRQKAKVA